MLWKLLLLKLKRNGIQLSGVYNINFLRVPEVVLVFIAGSQKFVFLHLLLLFLNKALPFLTVIQNFQEVYVPNHDISE